MEVLKVSQTVFDFRFTAANLRTYAAAPRQYRGNTAAVRVSVAAVRVSVAAVRVSVTSMRVNITSMRGSARQRLIKSLVRCVSLNQSFNKRARFRVSWQFDSHEESWTMHLRSSLNCNPEMPAVYFRYCCNCALFVANLQALEEALYSSVVPYATKIHGGVNLAIMLFKLMLLIHPASIWWRSPLFNVCKLPQSIRILFFLDAVLPLHPRQSIG
jgi:hypothetical protein